MLGDRPRSKLRRAAVPLVLTVLFVSLLALGAACGASSAEAGSFAETDSGGSSGGSSGGGRPDGSLPFDGAGAEASADSGVAPAHAVFIHGSRSLPDIRLCWRVNGVVNKDLPFPSTGVMPGSNYPGIPVGGAATFDGDASLPTNAPITFYAIKADILAEEAMQYTCDQLICEGQLPCLGLDDEYWAVPGSTLQPGPSAIAIVGCESTGPGQDPGATAARCGVDWMADAGNLAADLIQLATTLPPDGGGDAGFSGQLSVQAALLSPAAFAAMYDLDSGAQLLTVSFGAEGAEGGVVSQLAAEDTTYTPTMVEVGTDLAAFGQLGFTTDVPGVPAIHQWTALIQSQQLVDPTADPTVYFGQPRTYLVAIVGDPNAPHDGAPTTGDAGYDGTGLHVLVVAAPSP